MDEPWWEGHVAADVHRSLREKVSSSPVAFAQPGVFQSRFRCAFGIFLRSPRWRTRNLEYLSPPPALVVPQGMGDVGGRNEGLGNLAGVSEWEPHSSRCLEGGISHSVASQGYFKWFLGKILRVHFNEKVRDLYGKFCMQ